MCSPTLRHLEVLGLTGFFRSCGWTFHPVLLLPPSFLCRGWQHHGRIRLPALFCRFLKELVDAPRAWRAKQPLRTGGGRSDAPSRTAGASEPGRGKQVALVCCPCSCVQPWHLYLVPCLRSTHAGAELDTLGSTRPFDAEERCIS